MVKQPPIGSSLGAYAPGRPAEPCRKWKAVSTRAADSVMLSPSHTLSLPPAGQSEAQEPAAEATNAGSPILTGQLLEGVIGIRNSVFVLKVYEIRSRSRGWVGNHGGGKVS
jgi:hypothetical protein